LAVVIDIIRENCTHNGATVFAKSKKFALFLSSNFMYCENAVPIRVKLVCWVNFENWIEGTEDIIEDILFNKLRC
jgi:hypothetical protein